MTTWLALAKIAADLVAGAGLLLVTWSLRRSRS